MTKKKKKKARQRTGLNGKKNGIGIGRDQMLGKCFIC